MSSSSSSSSSSDDEAPVPKMARLDEPGAYSSVAQNLMSKMGFQKGKGLGRAGQGIVEPVGISKQRGRRGLGLIIQGLEEESVEWDSSREKVEVEESFQWISKSPTDSQLIPSLDEMKDWMVEGKRKKVIDDETKFCDPDVLSSILKCKSIFDRLEPEELRNARTRSNPFETIRGGLFQNRAAMKMANIDAVFDFMFTNPKNVSGEPVISPSDLLYFADVCAGPGGFSEYVLWRKQWRCKGFGFTLKGSHDFKLEDFFAGPPETFETHYGVNGIDGDGDVFKDANIKSFTKYVKENTDGLGVHFMMADGGFSVEGQENIQEILSKQLYLCQFVVALGIVRDRGHFVCKLFDLFTPFSVGLVYLMYLSFDDITIFKPNTSRPANSERYLVCRYKNSKVSDVVQEYMMTINYVLNQYGMTILGESKSDTDIVEIVPHHVMENNKEFYEFIRESNNDLGERQIIGLAKIAAFCKDQSLRELRQAELKDQCLHFWKVPNEVRKAPRFQAVQEKFDSLVGGMSHAGFIVNKGCFLTKENLGKFIKSKFDWKFVVSGSPNLSSETESNPTFFLGLGRNRVYKWVLSRGGSWEKVAENLKFDLPAGTLIYAEVVMEMRGLQGGTRRVAALHVLDAVFIGSEDLRAMDLKTRNSLVSMMAKAVNKFTRTDYIVVRAKELFNFERINQVISKFDYKICKSIGGTKERLTMTIDESPEGERYFIPSGIVMFKVVADPFTMAMSRTHNAKYWFDTLNNKSFFKCPPNATITFNSSFEKRLLWQFKNEFGVGVDLARVEEGSLNLQICDIASLLTK